MLPPIAGVIIASYYVRFKGDKIKTKAFSVIGIASWLSGVSIVFFIESDAKTVLGGIVFFCRLFCNYDRSKKIMIFFVKKKRRLEKECYICTRNTINRVTGP